jgi:hypothetical protein
MKQTVGVLGLAVAWTLAAGCSDTTPATEADYDDVAQALGGTVATSNGGGDMGSLHDSVSIAAGDPGLDISVKASGEFVGNRLGLDYDYSVKCVDAEGAPLAKCGDKTDGATADVTWSGKLESPNLTAMVSRDGQWKLTEIQSGTAAINGHGSFDLDVSFTSLFRAVTRTYTLNYDAQYSDVQVKLHPATIVGGKVNYDVHAERTASGPRRSSDANFDMNAVVEFTSAGHATITMDKKFMYSVDPTTGSVAKMGAAKP